MKSSAIKFCFLFIIFLFSSCCPEKSETASTSNPKEISVELDVVVKHVGYSYNYSHVSFSGYYKNQFLLIFYAGDWLDDVLIRGLVEKNDTITLKITGHESIDEELLTKPFHEIVLSNILEVNGIPLAGAEIME